MAVTRVSNSVIEDNSINASKLSVSSNGTAGQLLKSNGDGTFSWDSESTYSNVYSIVVGTPPVDLDSIEKIAASINDDAAFYTTITGITGGLQNSIDAIEATDITLTISGDASGSATFTNLGNATLTLTIADDSHNHVISNVDGLQAALDLKASITYVDTAVANLIDAAPGALDTLNELAAAIGDDSNFASTVTTALAGKQPIGTYNTIIGTDTDIDTSGSTIIDNIFVTDGVITSMGTRVLTLADLGYTGATNANYITNNNQLTNGAGYTTNVGDITGVTAGSGITGGGTSGTVTINHADTSAQGSVNNSGNTVIQDVTLDTYGHVTGLVSSTITSISGNAATATLAANSTLAGGLAVGTGVNNTANQIVRTNASGYVDFGWINTVSGNTTATLTDIYVNTNDGYIRKATPAHFRSQITDGVYYPNTNPNGYTSNVGDITGVTAGAGLDGGGTSGTVTLSIESDLRGEAWLIGRSTADYINVNTTVIDFALDGVIDMRLYNSGDLHVEGDVIAYSTSVSDSRLKDNIKTIDNALDKVEKLRGVEYDWNKGSRKGQHEIGVIAQEVEEVFPFLVREKVKSTGEFENDETAYKTVDYEKLVGVLIESVKELSAKVKTLEAKIQ